MAIFLSSFYFKLAAVSTGVLSVAAATMRFSGPSVSHFAVSYFPIIYDNVVFFLRPPYIYLVINCIIISIAVSSKLQKNPSSGGDHYSSSEEEAPFQVPMNVREAYVTAYNEFVENNALDDAGDDRTVENARRSPEVIAEKITSDGGDERLTSKNPKPSSGSNEFSMSKEEEKPPASARFGQRKAFKSSPEGGNKTASLGVSKPKRQDTLETTWKKITEGRSMPLTRHLKKSDTWEKERSHVGSSENNQRMVRSENLNYRKTAADKRPRRPEPQPERLMRQPSPGQEELNRRVEAFIKKFNEDMRLQRQESLAKYREIVNEWVLQ